MIFVIGLVMCVIVSVICQLVLYSRSVFGDMDIKWDEEKQSWIATMHISPTIDYSKKRKLVLKINKK